VRVSELYRGVHAPVLVTDPASAEMIKYASNAFLATKISFINAIANLCEAVDADVREVAIGMGYDARIGFQFLHPGPGFGGSCFPKDVAALLHTARDAGYDFQLLDGVVEVNRGQHDRIVDKVRVAAGGSLTGAEVAVWGLTFKADTDDLRDSPSLVVARKLIEAGAAVRGYDPVAGEAAGVLMPELDVRADPYEAAVGADVVALLTEWEELRWLDFERVRSLMRHPAVVDARNLLDPAAMRRRGFEYTGVGRR
jgi:UDPglucose 6-dehydrogenase